MKSIKKIAMFLLLAVVILSSAAAERYSLLSNASQVKIYNEEGYRLNKTNVLDSNWVILTQNYPLAFKNNTLVAELGTESLLRIQKNPYLLYGTFNLKTTEDMVVRTPMASYFISKDSEVFFDSNKYTETCFILAGYVECVNLYTENKIISSGVGTIKLDKQPIFILNNEIENFVKNTPAEKPQEPEVEYIRAVTPAEEAKEVKIEPAVSQPIEEPAVEIAPVKTEPEKEIVFTTIEEPAPEPVVEATPAVEEVPVAEEPAPEPVVETTPVVEEVPVAEEPAPEPVVETTPVVEEVPVAEEPAPEPVVEATPVVEEVPVAEEPTPEPVVETTPVVEEVPVAEEPAPEPVVETTPVVEEVPVAEEPAPEPAKEEKAEKPVKVKKAKKARKELKDIDWDNLFFRIGIDAQSNLFEATPLFSFSEEAAAFNPPSYSYFLDYYFQEVEAGNQVDLDTVEESFFEYVTSRFSIFPYIKIGPVFAQVWMDYDHFMDHVDMFDPEEWEEGEYRKFLFDCLYDFHIADKNGFFFVGVGKNYAIDFINPVNAITTANFRKGNALENAFKLNVNTNIVVLHAYVNDITNIGYEAAPENSKFTGAADITIRPFGAGSLAFTASVYSEEIPVLFDEQVENFYPAANLYIPFANKETVKFGVNAFYAMHNFDFTELDFAAGGSLALDSKYFDFTVGAFYEKGSFFMGTNFYDSLERGIEFNRTRYKHNALVTPFASLRLGSENAALSVAAAVPLDLEDPVLIAKQTIKGFRTGNELESSADTLSLGLVVKTDLISLDAGIRSIGAIRTFIDAYRYSVTPFEALKSVIDPDTLDIYAKFEFGYRLIKVYANFEYSNKNLLDWGRSISADIGLKLKVGI